MSELPNNVDRLLDLAEAACDKIAPKDDLVTLDSILLNDRASRRCYLDYCWMHVTLGLEMRAHEAAQKVRQQINIELGVSDPSDCDVTRAKTPSTTSITFLSTTPPSTVGFFSSGWPVAYLIATVVVGIGLWISSVTPAFYPQQIAKRSSSTRETESAPEPQMEFVGRITGLAECRWVKDVAPLLVNDTVPVGREVRLESGLMEIAYDSGAKVILQGPVTYEVESAAGGFLSVGKLTARIGNKAERSNPQSSTPNPLFAVRTPTVTVTDLGTEFGVAVASEGRTEVQVLKGAVEMGVPGPDGSVQRRRRVTAGSAVAIERHDKPFESVAFAGQSFVRTLRVPTKTSAEAAYIRAVLADRPMGYWPLNEPAGSWKFADRSGHGFHGQTTGKVAARKADFLRGGSLAAVFDGDSCIDMGQRNQFASLDDFTVEAWLSIGEMARFCRVVSAVNVQDASSNGWALTAQRQGSQGNAALPVVVRLMFYGGSFFDFHLPGSETSEGRWLHVALVFDRTTNTAYFYLNGEHRESARGKAPLRGQWAWVNIGSDPVNPGEYWRGGLGHVAVYPYALSAPQIKKHFDQRNVEQGK
jgi:hypothetical protein